MELLKRKAFPNQLLPKDQVMSFSFPIQSIECVYSDPYRAIEKSTRTFWKNQRKTINTKPKGIRTNLLHVYVVLVVRSQLHKEIVEYCFWIIASAYLTLIVRESCCWQKTITVSSPSSCVLCPELSAIITTFAENY